MSNRTRPLSHTCHRRPIWVASALIALLSLFAAEASARRGEAPFTPAGSGLSGTPTLAVSAPDVVALRAEDAARRDAGEKTFRYADPVRVSASPATDGVWEMLADGTRMWRLAVHGDGATDLNLGFETYELPYGAKLWVISAERDYYEGPYTHEDNAEHGQLWVPVVPGDAAIVELQLPAPTKFEPRLELTHVGYGYTDIFGSRPLARQGSCNNDVICPEGDPWRDQIQSVATYSLGGSTICSGQMVIDAEGSFKPFFLTAYHCGVSPSNAASMTVYWNFESPVCGQLSGGSLAQNQTGAIFRARRQDVDAALVELDEFPDPDFNVFYSGWDRSGDVPQGSVGIHHPNTDEKAISFNFDPLTTQSSCIGGPGTPATHWRVNNWEDGTTEPGSSGSGLWDPDNKLLVGFLSGGLASCTLIEYDCYGKFAVAWDGASPSERLRDWLDPNDVGGPQVQGSFPSNDGQLALNSTTAVDACGSDSDGVIAPGETVTLDVEVRALFGDVTGLSATLQTVTPGVTIVQGQSAYPDLLKDTAGSNVTPFEIELDLAVPCFSEVTVDAVFNDDQGYVFEFPIVLTVGQLAAPAGLPLAIPDNTSVTSTFGVGENLTLTDLNVFVQIDHTYVGDLLIELESPAGTTITLLDRPGVPASSTGCSNDNMVITFDDESLQQVENRCVGTDPWFTGAARPVDPLSILDGESTQGTWSLTVTDNAGGDTGSIVDWQLITTPSIQAGICEPCIPTGVPGLGTVSKAYPGTVSLFVVPDGSGDRLDNAQAWSGIPGDPMTRVDSTIEVIVTDLGGVTPVEGLPASDVVLASSLENLTVCGPQIADGPTDAAGRTTFTGSLEAGGAIDLGAGETMVVLSGSFLTAYTNGGDGLDIRFNSPDLNGSGLVDLADVALLASAFAGPYDYAIDYVWDGTTNIADIGRFAAALTSGCVKSAKSAPVALARASMDIEIDERARELRPGDEFTARIVLRGDEVEQGIQAWEATLRSSANLRVVDVETPEGSMNLGEGSEIIVGAGAADLRSNTGSLVLARLRLVKSDATPAWIELAEGPLAMRGENGPSIVVREAGLRVVADSGASRVALDDSKGTPSTPRTLALSNVPNPFNPSTEIALRLPETGRVDVAIFDVSGRLVRDFALGTIEAGEHRFTWRGDDDNGRPVVSGVYFAQVYLDGKATGVSRKLALLK